MIIFSLVVIYLPLFRSKSKLGLLQFGQVSYGPFRFIKHFCTSSEGGTFYTFFISYPCLPWYNSMSVFISTTGIIVRLSLIFVMWFVLGSLPWSPRMRSHLSFMLYGNFLISFVQSLSAHFVFMIFHQFVLGACVLTLILL